MLPMGTRTKRKWDTLHGALLDLLMHLDKNYEEVKDLFKHDYPGILQQIKEDVDDQYAGLTDSFQHLQQALDNIGSSQDYHEQAKKTARLILETIKPITGQVERVAFDHMLARADAQQAQPLKDEAEEARLRQARDEWRSRVKALETQLDVECKNKDAQIADLQVEIGRAKQRADHNYTAAMNARTKRDDALIQKNELDGQNAEQQDRLETLGHELDDLRESINAAEGERDSAHADLEDAHGDIERLNGNLADMKLREDQLQRRADAADGRTKDLERRLREADAKLAAARKELDTEQQEARESWRKANQSTLTTDRQHIEDINALTTKHAADISRLQENITNDRKQSEIEKQVLKGNVEALKGGRQQMRDEHARKMDELRSAHEQKITTLTHNQQTQIQTMQQAFQNNLTHAGVNSQKAIDLETVKRKEAEERATDAHEKVLSAEGQVVQLRGEIASVSQAAMNSDKELARLRSHQADMRNEQKMLNETIDRQKEQLASMKMQWRVAMDRTAKIEEQQRMVEESEAEISRLQETIDNLENTFKDELGAKATEFEDRLRQVRSDYDERIARLEEDHNSNMDEAKSKHEEHATLTIKSHQTEIERLNTAVTELKQETASCKGRCEVHVNTIRTLTKERDDARDNHAAEVKKTTSTTQEAATLAAQQLERQQNLEKRANEAQKSLSDAREQISELSLRVEDLSSKVSAITSKAETFSELLQQEKEEHNTTRQVLSQAQLEASHFENEWKTYEAQLEAEFNEQLSEIQFQRDESNRRHMNGIDLLTEEQVKNDELKATLSETKHALQETRRQLSTKVFMLESTLSMKDKLSAENSMLTVSSQMTAARVREAMRKQFMPLEEEVEQCKLQIEVLQRKCDSAESDVDRLSGENQQLEEYLTHVKRKCAKFKTHFKHSVKDTALVQQLLEKSNEFIRELVA